MFLHGLLLRLCVINVGESAGHHHAPGKQIFSDLHCHPSSDLTVILLVDNDLLIDLYPRNEKAIASLNIVSGLLPLCCRSACLAGDSPRSGRVLRLLAISILSPSLCVLDALEYFHCSLGGTTRAGGVGTGCHPSRSNRVVVKWTHGRAVVRSHSADRLDDRENLVGLESFEDSKDQFALDRKSRGRSYPV